MSNLTAKRIIREWEESAEYAPTVLSNDRRAALVRVIAAALAAKDAEIARLTTERDGFQADAAHREMENHSLQQEIASLRKANRALALLPSPLVEEAARELLHEEITTLTAALAACREYVAHTQDCVLSFWEAVDPEKGWKYRGQWSQKQPVCTCGLAQVLATLPPVASTQEPA